MRCRANGSAYLLLEVRRPRPPLPQGDPQQQGPGVAQCPKRWQDGRDICETGSTPGAGWGGAVARAWSRRTSKGHGPLGRCHSCTQLERSVGSARKLVPVDDCCVQSVELL